MINDPLPSCTHGRSTYNTDMSNTRPTPTRAALAACATLFVAAVVWPCPTALAADRRAASPRRPTTRKASVRPDRSKAAAKRTRTVSPRSRRIAGRAGRTRSGYGIDFADTPLPRVIRHFRERYDLNIVVRWRVLEDALDRDRDDMLVNVKLKGVRVGTALEVVLDYAQGAGARIGYVVRGGVITISTREDLNSRPVTRVYKSRNIKALRQFASRGLSLR